jgi:hypothetical protein
MNCDTVSEDDRKLDMSIMLDRRQVEKVARHLAYLDTNAQYVVFWIGPLEPEWFNEYGG